MARFFEGVTPAAVRALVAHQRAAWAARDAARSVICTCGWGGVFPTLKATNAAVAQHLEEGCEGCDHAVDIEEARS